MLPIEKIDPEADHDHATDVFQSNVDLTVLGDYESLQVAGEPDLIVELIDLYVDDAPVRVSSMRESQAKGNWISVKQQAHSLRGSSGSTGALQMASTCRERHVWAFGGLPGNHQDGRDLEEEFSRL